jgi:hypothetical protein
MGASRDRKLVLKSTYSARISKMGIAFLDLASLISF